MDHNYSAEFLASFKYLKHSFIVVEEVCALISHEQLEGRDTSLYYLFHLSGDLRVPVGYSTVQRVVAVHFLIGSCSPIVVSMDQSLLGWDDEIDKTGCAASDCSLSALIEIVDSCGAHEWQF